jgi:Flp pilus assembly pilin Flp
MSDSKLREATATLLQREEGQTMAEYGVVLTVITVASVAIFTALGDSVEGAITKVITLLPV